QLCKLERLRHVIIRTKLQAYDLVDSLGASRQNQNGSCHSCLADFAADVQAALRRQHEVQEHQVERQISDLFKRFMSVDRGVHVVSFTPQSVAQRGAQG